MTLRRWRGRRPLPGKDGLDCRTLWDHLRAAGVCTGVKGTLIIPAAQVCAAGCDCGIPCIFTLIQLTSIHFIEKRFI